MALVNISEPRKPTLTFLGIGLMGLPMEKRLLQTGYPLHVWNRTLSKAKALAPSGAIVHKTAANALPLPASSLQFSKIVISVA